MAAVPKRNSLDFLSEVAAVGWELIVESGQYLNCFYVLHTPQGTREGEEGEKARVTRPPTDNSRLSSPSLTEENMSGCKSYQEDSLVLCV